MGNFSEPSRDEPSASKLVKVMPASQFECRSKIGLEDDVTDTLAVSVNRILPEPIYRRKYIELLALGTVCHRPN